jgi:cytochrome c oxidase subunit 2
MRTLLSKSAFKGLAMAAGLALAGLSAAGHAQPAPASATAPGAPKAVVAAPVASSSPELAMDGAPAMTVKPMIGQPTDGLYGLQPQVTKNGQFAHWMHDVILVPLITAISLFVLGLLMWVAFRYRASRNPVPSKTSHNTVIEIVWTLLPVVILVLIAVVLVVSISRQWRLRDHRQHVEREEGRRPRRAFPHRGRRPPPARVR